MICKAPTEYLLSSFKLMRDMYSLELFQCSDGHSGPLKDRLDYYSSILQCQWDLEKMAREVNSDWCLEIEQPLPPSFPQELLDFNGLNKYLILKWEVKDSFIRTINFELRISLISGLTRVCCDIIWEGYAPRPIFNIGWSKIEKIEYNKCPGIVFHLEGGTVFKFNSRWAHVNNHNLNIAVPFYTP